MTRAGSTPDPGRLLEEGERTEDGRRWIEVGAWFEQARASLAGKVILREGAPTLAELAWAARQAPIDVRLDFLKRLRGHAVPDAEPMSDRELLAKILDGRLKPRKGPSGAYAGDGDRAHGHPPEDGHHPDDGHHAG